MAIPTRIFECGKCDITEKFSDKHKGLDVVDYKHASDGVDAHSDGTVVEVEKGCNYNTYPQGPNIYGNYVKIKHDNGYYTLYAHLVYDTIPVKKGDRVKKGEYIGWMGNTGYSNGAHVHFEVRNENDVRINPEPYLNSDLPGSTITPNVPRDPNVNQVEVLINNLNVRFKPSVKVQSLGFAKKGFYNVIESCKSEGYLWYKIGTDNWIAYSDEWAKYYPKEETDYKKLYEEELEKNKLLETEISVLKDKIDKAIKDLS